MMSQIQEISQSWGTTNLLQWSRTQPSSKYPIRSIRSTIQAWTTTTWCVFPKSKLCKMSSFPNRSVNSSSRLRSCFQTARAGRLTCNWSLHSQSLSTRKSVRSPSSTKPLTSRGSMRRGMVKALTRMPCPAQRGNQGWTLNPKCLLGNLGTTIWESQPSMVILWLHP